MPATRRRGKHAAPGGFSPLRAAALPCALLGAAGAAFAGLAVVPASAMDQRVTAAQALAPVELPAPAPVADPNVALAAALEQGLADATARDRGQRASRSRSLTSPEPEAEAEAEAEVVKVLFARPGDGRRTSGYGRRWGRLHAGIDLAAGTGSPIRAVAAGVVKSAGRESGYGNCVRIIHADGTETVYAHMSRIIASDGERVEAGELIGQEGNTGRSTGPHLHFEVRINGTPVNPAAWLRKRGIAV